MADEDHFKTEKIENIRRHESDLMVCKNDDEKPNAHLEEKKISNQEEHKNSVNAEPAADAEISG